jgi:MarR family transcriptional regulator, lower aerobic nicotinate degradation pathway regulator
MRSHSESTLAALDMRPRHLLTLTVLRDLGGSTQQALATRLSIDRTNLVGLLNELETEGLIERRRSPEDRRRHIVEITPPGRETLAKAEFALAAVEDAVLAALDTEQREALYQLLVQATGDLNAGLSSSC